MMRRVAGPQTPHQETLDVQWVPIESVKLWAKNPRRNDRAAEKLAETIKVNGFRVPLIVWRKNMTVYAGNTRYKAAKLLGLKTVPVHFQDFESEAKAIEFALADNRLGEAADWDDDGLGVIFNDELVEIDVEKAQASTGFDAPEIGGLRTGWKASENDPAKEWQGMPEFAHEDQTSFRHIVVHFKSDEDATEFGRRIGQTVTEKTRSLWFPPDEIGTIKDKRYGEKG